MTSTALVTVLRAAGRAGVAVCLWGDPGIANRALNQAAAAADDVPSETVIGSLREPSDFAGLRWLPTTVCAWSHPPGPSPLVAWWRLRCGMCGGNSAATELTTRTIRVEQSIDWRAEQPRPGRPPKWLVEQRPNHASEVA